MKEFIKKAIYFDIIYNLAHIFFQIPSYLTKVIYFELL